MEEVRQWQNRPLDALSPIVYGDGLVIKVRENPRVLNKALYLALGVDMEGPEEVLGMWLAQNEGARFWLSVFTELHNRGLKALFIACMDGLPGLPDAGEALYPQTPFNSACSIWCATPSNPSPTPTAKRWQRT